MASLHQDRQALSLFLSIPIGHEVHPGSSPLWILSWLHQILHLVDLEQGKGSSGTSVGKLLTDWSRPVGMEITLG